MEWIQGLDHDILLYVAQHVRQDWLTPIVTLITSLGNLAGDCTCAGDSSAYTAVWNCDAAGIAARIVDWKSGH